MPFPVINPFLYQSIMSINSWFNNQTWGMLEIILSIIIFFLSLYIRSADPLFDSTLKYTNSLKIKLKISQFGLYLQAFLASIFCLDGYETMINNEIPHILLIFLIFNCIILKVYMLICVQERKYLFKKKETFRRFGKHLFRKKETLKKILIKG